MNANAIRMPVRSFILLVLCAVIPSCGGSGGGSGTGTDETKYLTFQVFTGAATAEVAFSGTAPLVRTPKNSISTLVQSIVAAIGQTGDARTKLGFVIGPIAFDHTDSDVIGMIHDGFSIARELNLAVGFHVDDAMFWSASRTLLPSVGDTLEWVDFTPTASAHLVLDWGQRQAFPPRMCMNSHTVLAEVTRRATTVIGGTIRAEVEALTAEGRGELFAGVIVGWESHMGHEFAADPAAEKLLGFHALSNSGYGPGNPPPSFGDHNAQVVKAFIEHWSEGLIAGGIPESKLYAHINFLPESEYALAQQSNPTLAGVPYNEIVSTAPSSIHPEVAFGTHYRPGFSLYPTPGTWDAVRELLLAHGSPAWAQSEGVNAIPGLGGADTVSGGQTPEQFLAQRFNHGAVLVN